ncbi:MAG: hypothetical protein OXC95_02900 [Dehalococcoidia bacterium]|nr:hypothetical protein [Dehalococcoidia bacterium]
MVITRARADIEVRGPDGNIALLVEVKGLRGKDDGWLAEYRRNLAQTILVAPTAYFMIVMGDYMYLWKRGNSPDMDMPDFKVPTVPLLTTEVFKADKLQRYSGRSLAIIVAYWLGTLAIDDDMLRGEELPEPVRMFEARIYDRIKGGSVHRGEDPRW